MSIIFLTKTSFQMVLLSKRCLTQDLDFLSFQTWCRYWLSFSFVAMKQCLFRLREILSRLALCFSYLSLQTLSATWSITIDRLTSLCFSIDLFVQNNNFGQLISYRNQSINTQFQMGNNRSEVELAIQLDKEFYYAGETLHGKLLINAKKKFSCSMIALFIEGLEKCEFIASSRETIKGETQLINTSHILHQFGENHELKGQHVFPFSFRFMNFLPGSYNETKEYKAQISYMLKATLQPHSKKKTSIETSIEVIIRQPQKEGERMLQGECFAKSKQCGCFDKGTSRVISYFEKNYYFPQDQCIMICEADNLKSKVGLTKINCEFVKQVTLTGSNGISMAKSQILNVVDFSGVPAGMSYYGNNSQRNAMKLVYKDTGLGVHPTTNGKSVKCEYYILVKPQFDGLFVSTELNECKVKLNILQPAMIYEPLVQPDSWRPEIEENINIYLDFSKQNEQITAMSGQL